MKRKVQVRRPTRSNAPDRFRGSPARSSLDRAAVSPHWSDSAAYIPASEAKNRFAAVLEDVSKGREVFITKHNATKAVLISIEKFNSLSAATTSVLDKLTADFDRRLAAMQTVDSRDALEVAFNASPAELGRAALKAVRSRRER